MASSAAIAKEIAIDLRPYIITYKDGSVERPLSSPFVPPSPQDPETGVSSKDVVISQNPPISARLYLPNNAKHTQKKLPILVYFHGGGFFFESAFSSLYHRYLNTLVSQSNVIGVSVEYRLAPENPLPSAYEDCWAALQWVASNSANNPTKNDPWLINQGNFDRIYIGGDSAGGNIVHNMFLRAGSEHLCGDVKITGAFASHPYFMSSNPIGSEPVEGFENSLNFRVWGLVYPCAPNGIDNPMINPLGPGAPSLAGLGCSKLLVFVAGKDDLRDRGIWYYEAVKKSGWEGEVELFEVEGEVHAFHIFDPVSENAMKMTKRLITLLGLDF